MDRVRGAEALAVVEPVGFEIEGDDLGRAALFEGEVEPEAG